MHVILTVCPKNWVRFHNSCYKFSSKSASWNAAKASCEAQGSHLVVINSRAENQAIGTRSSHTMFIGLHRDPKDQSRWLWVDGSRPTFTNWCSGEPDNVLGTETCVNTAGDYKSECPDSELSLSSDNKTCHGQYKLVEIT